MAKYLRQFTERGAVLLDPAGWEPVEAATAQEALLKGAKLVSLPELCTGHVAAAEAENLHPNGAPKWIHSFDLKIDKSGLN